MGMDYSYRLYFKKDRLWDVVQGLVAIAEPHSIPTLIRFPDHVLSIPFDAWIVDTWSVEKANELRCDDTRFDFAIVLNFDPDEAIQDYFDRMRRSDDILRSPPDTGEHKMALGYIYLTVYQEIPEHPGSDLVLFDFGTTGTRMSLLFDESTSIRKTFLELLSKFQGVCGVFNREDSGELFWLKGQEQYQMLYDPSMLPDEIEQMVAEGSE